MLAPACHGSRSPACVAAQVEVLQAEAGHRDQELQQAKENQGKIELKLEHTQSQLKQSETVAADHDALITEHHQTQMKLRDVEAEMTASRARERSMVASVEAATEERVVYRIMLRGVLYKRKAMQAKYDSMAEEVQPASACAAPAEWTQRARAAVDTQRVRPRRAAPDWRLTRAGAGRSKASRRS